VIDGRNRGLTFIGIVKRLGGGFFCGGFFSPRLKGSVNTSLGVFILCLQAVTTCRGWAVFCRKESRGMKGLGREEVYYVFTKDCRLLFSAVFMLMAKGGCGPGKKGNPHREAFLSRGYVDVRIVRGEGDVKGHSEGKTSRKERKMTVNAQEGVAGKAMERKDGDTRRNSLQTVRVGGTSSGERDVMRWEFLSRIPMRWQGVRRQLTKEEAQKRNGAVIMGGRAELTRAVGTVLLQVTKKISITQRREKSKE